MQNMEFKKIVSPAQKKFLPRRALALIYISSLETVFLGCRMS